MNKLIKTLLENLFDDYDDIFQDDTEYEPITKHLLKDDVEKAIKWVRNNISLIDFDDIVDDDIDEYVTITVDDDYQLNLEIVDYEIKFENPIPDYVRINKIKGCCATFSSSDNLPKEIEGTLQIKSNEIKFNGLFPSRLDALYIECPKLKSLKGLNDSCASIYYVRIDGCKNLQDLTGLPDSVNYLLLKDCNFLNLKGCPKQLKKLEIDYCDNLENLIGLPESVDNIELSYLGNFSSLEGCPAQLNELRIRNAFKLKSLKYISPLITRFFSVQYTGLVDLSNGPKEVGGNYYCIDNPNLKCLNAQDTVMTGHDTTFYCYGNDILKELTELPTMKYEDIKINTKLKNSFDNCKQKMDNLSR